MLPRTVCPLMHPLSVDSGLMAAPSSNAPADDETPSPVVTPEELPAEAPLPPIEPPSARFIVQLFVVPALIVTAVIGVYLLFGKLASSDADWRELVVDLRSSNNHTRWRGANGLAQLLEADSAQQRRARSEGVAGSPPISSDPELAKELSQTLSQELSRPTTDPDQQRLVEYLIKSLGWMDVPEAVLPTLVTAFETTSDPFLKQQSLVAIGMVTGRAMLGGKPVDAPDLTEFLLEVSQGEPGVLRHLSTYNLGFFLTDPRAQTRLRILLLDPDEKTRLNAAVGLARQNSPDALPVFEAILADALKFNFDPTRVKNEAEGNVYFERKQAVANALVAASQLSPALSPEQRASLAKLVQPLTIESDLPDNDLRYLAIEAHHALSGK